MMVGSNTHLQLLQWSFGVKVTIWQMATSYKGPLCRMQVSSNSDLFPLFQIVIFLATHSSLRTT